MLLRKLCHIYIYIYNSNILDRTVAGVSEPCMRKVLRHNLLHPAKHLTSLEDCGEDYRDYFLIFLATTIILLLIISLSSIVFYCKSRSGWNMSHKNQQKIGPLSKILKAPVKGLLALLS